MIVEQVETKREFQPVTISITLENPEEVAELWHRTNFSGMGYYSYEYAVREWASDKLYALWNSVNKIADAQKINIRKM